MGHLPGQQLKLTAALFIFALVFVTPRIYPQFGPSTIAPESAFNIPQDQLLKPETLLQMLKSPGANKPLVLQVGSRMLFAQGHIAGSEYAGPGSQATGIQLLENRVNSLPRKKLIVLYCGCCPWVRCPNLEPAFAKLRAMGFTNVKALYLADNFGADWADKGYPVERGQ